MHSQSSSCKKQEIGFLLRSASRELEVAGCASPFLDVGLLIAYVLETSREYILGHKEECLDSQQYQLFLELLQRRVQREPMSHLLGYREFYGYQFKVTKDTLDPRPDSEILIEAVLNNIRTLPQENLHILDLGLGTGCLLLTVLKKINAAQGVGVDISPDALLVAQENACSLGVDSRVNFICSNWLEKVEGVFDLIIANPPYISKNELHNLEPEVQLYEPHLALTDGKDGYDCYRSIATSLINNVHQDSLIFFEIGQGQENQVISFMERGGYILVDRYKDLSGIIRCLLFRLNIQK